MFPSKSFLGVFGRRLFLVLAALSLALVGSVGFLGYWNARHTITHNATDFLFEIARERRSKLDIWFDERMREITLLAELPEVKQLTEYILRNPQSSSYQDSHLLEILQVHHRTYPAYGACGIFDISGKPLLQESTCPNKRIIIAHLPELEKALHSPKPVMGTLHLLEPGLAGINLTKSITDTQGRVIAVLYFLLLPEITLNELLSDYSGLGETGETYLVGADTTMLTPSRHRHHPPELTHKMPTEGVLNCLSGKDSVGVYRSYTGEKVVGAYVWMPRQQWALIAEMYADEAFTPLYKVATQFVVVLGLGLVLVFALSYFISRRLTLPIFKLVSASNAVASGNLDIQVTGTGDDEVGRLTRQFNQMVSALKRSRDQIETSHHQLLQAEKLAAVGRLVAGIVHEMRNPLSAIKMNLRILEKKAALSEVETEHLQIASHQTRRLEQMLSELLEYSKPITPNLSRVKLVQLIEKILADKSGKLEEKQIRVLSKFPGEAVELESDPDLLTRILDNILDNAINASREGQTVAIRVSDGKAVTVSISDEGAGMPPQIRERIFEPFFTTRQEGVGLGLSNVKKFLDLLGGTIEVQSQEGSGTMVIISFNI